jgi:hypothetical protein
MNVLMLGRNEAMLEMGAAPIRDAGHAVTTTLSDDHARSELSTGNFKAIVLGMAVEQSARAALKQWVADKALAIKILEPMSPMDLPDVLQTLSA